MSRKIGFLVLGVSTLSYCCGCSKESEPPHHRKNVTELAPPPGVEVDAAKLSMYAPLPATFESKTNPVTDDKVSLGKALFLDPKLSKDGKVSCNSCHDLGKHGAGGPNPSTGTTGAKESRNTPTVFDAAGQFTQFWDGRAETIEDATKTELLAATGMGSDDKRVVAAVKANAAYGETFKKAFPDDQDPVSLDNVVKALAAFERKLVTPSKWDRFLGGEKAALTDDEKKGFLKFVEVGCPTCHVGALVGGTMFQKLGKEKPWPEQKDKGRSAVTKTASDDMMFKVAQLRNVEYTAPYFHDGSGTTLDQAVKAMASHQLAKELTDQDAGSIVLWLKTLSGAVPEALAK